MPSYLIDPMKLLARAWLYILIPSAIIACDAGRGPASEATSLELNDSLRSETDLTGITIGYSTPSLNAPFYVVLSQYIERYAEAYGMNFVMADGQDDIIKQITSMEDLITSGVDIMVLNPLDYKALVPVVNAVWPFLWRSQWVKKQVMRWSAN